MTFCMPVFMHMQSKGLLKFGGGGGGGGRQDREVPLRYQLIVLCTCISIQAGRQLSKNEKIIMYFGMQRPMLHLQSFKNI